MKHEKNDVTPNMPALEAVLASKGITRSYLERHSGITKYILNKLMAGRNVTMETAEKMCMNLGKDFDDLFMIAVGRNRTAYATLSVYDTSAEDEVCHGDECGDEHVNKNTRKITEQYACQQCGHMSQKQVSVRGKYMCVRCAQETRCHVCFRVTNLLYVKGNMEICPKCQKRIETGYVPNADLDDEDGGLSE